MTAWRISEYEEGTTLMIAERNPYYWRVDAEGNQLPYIDRVYFHFVENADGVNAMGIAGDLSMQARAISLTQYPVYQENAEAGNYHMLLWPQATQILAKAGFDKVANLSGGMLRWRSQRFPVEGGTD